MVWANAYETVGGYLGRVGAEDASLCFTCGRHSKCTQWMLILALWSFSTCLRRYYSLAFQPIRARAQLSWETTDRWQSREVWEGCCTPVNVLSCIELNGCRRCGSTEQAGGYMVMICWANAECHNVQRPSLCFFSRGKRALSHRSHTTHWGSEMATGGKVKLFIIAKRYHLRQIQHGNPIVGYKFELQNSC